jgi:hypothetical protein
MIMPVGTRNPWFLFNMRKSYLISAAILILISFDLCRANIISNPCFDSHKINRRLK